MVKIMCTTSKELLDEYNKVMERFDEDPYIIKPDYVGDCSEDILQDTAAVDGKDFVVVSAEYLVEEVRWNLTEKQQSMAREACDFGEITEAQRRKIVRQTNAAYNRIKKLAESSPVVEQWFLTEV